MRRVAGAILALTMLSGCGADRDASTEQPAFYVSMANASAKLDPNVAASMISGYRQNNGLGAVAVDPLLMKAAEAQSNAMASRNKLDHNVAGALDKRIKASGFDATKAVENVSAGYHTLAEAFSGWRDSPPHKANMLATGVTKIGIAATYAPNTKYKVFWTLILAAPDAR
jgi:uncharacterized protein YkwD